MSQLPTTNYQLPTKEGFTLIETLVVVFIMIVLGSLLLANARQPSRKFELQRDAQTLSADIRRSQSLAVTAQEVTCGGQTKVPYYGFITQQNQSQAASYSIFVDCNRNSRFESSGPGGDYYVETINLVNSVVWSTTPSSGGSNYLHVVYIPPNPDVEVRQGNTSGGASQQNVNTFTVRLCHRRETTRCLDIQGNISGNVEVL